MASNPYSDWGDLPDWQTNAPTISDSMGDAVGLSLDRLDSIANKYRELTGGDDSTVFDALGDYDPNQEEEYIRKSLVEDTKGFIATERQQRSDLLKSQTGMQKKIGKSGIRSGSAMSQLSKLKNQYGEDLTTLRKDMRAKRTKAIADIYGKREDFKTSMESNYLSWLGGDPTKIDEQAQLKLNCAEKGGTWVVDQCIGG